MGWLWVCLCPSWSAPGLEGALCVGAMHAYVFEASGRDLVVVVVACDGVAVAA